jgi:hypothetical protein
MSLTIEPQKGIRLSLSHYSAIKTWQGGGKFWEHDFQLTVRQGALQEFLPRVTDEGAVVLYEQVVDGSEVVSTSVASGGRNKVPAAQIDRLRRALDELKAKAEDPHCDANKRRMIEAFRLPDPLKDAELYRLYGSGRKKRLLVLWGVEKEAGSAIAPLKALDRMPAEAGGMEWAKWLWIILLILLLAAGVLLARSCREEKTGGGVSPSPITLPSTNGASAIGTKSNSPNTPDGYQFMSPQSSPTNSLGDEASKVMVWPQSGGSSHSTPHDIPSPDRVAGADATSNYSNAPSDSGATVPQSSPTNSLRDGASRVAVQPQSDGSPYSTPPDTESPDRAAHGTGTNTNALSPAVTPEDTLPVSVSTPTAGSLDAATGTPPRELSPDPTKTASDIDPTKTPDASASPIQPSDTTQPTAANPVATGGATRIKISAVPQGETVNDRVTILLTAAGQDGKGALVSGGIRVTKWIVDSVEQRVNGVALAESTLPITLKKGVHHVVAEGVSGNRKIRSEADVDVALKHTTQSAVTVMPSR